jgi:hypothetical protein
MTAREYYPKRLGELTGIRICNFGVGGEGVGTILGRMNAIPIKVKENVLIPSDKQEVEIKLTNIYNQLILPLMGGNSASVVINGIKGVLRNDQMDTGAESANYYFTRDEVGESTTFYVGDNVMFNYNENLSDVNRYKIVWVGQNGGYSENEDKRWGYGDAHWANYYDRLIDMIKVYISVSRPKNYLIIAPTSGKASLREPLEKKFEEAFGCNFFNARLFMLNHGLDYAKSLGYLENSTSYPTEQDVLDMSEGIIPSTLRTDGIHFTDFGFKVLAEGIYERIKVIWGVSPLSRKV